MAASNLFFTDNSGQYNVVLPCGEYEKILKYCVEANPCETGGILIGNYSEDCSVAIIKEATSPPIDSKHKRSNFFRGTANLMKKLDDAWVEGDYYLGEWHYHPNALSAPSWTDLKQMRTLSMDKNLNCPEPILLIVGENNTEWEIHIEICCGKKNIKLKQNDVDS